MNLHSILNSRKALAAASVLALGACLTAVPARADQWDHKTILKVGQTIQVQDTVLQPGTYVLKLYNSQAERHIVQIFNEDQTRVINTIQAMSAQRMEPTGKTQFTFWETPAGTARAMRTWYYPGDLIGQEFSYPKHPKEIAMVTSSAATSSATSMPSETTANTESSAAAEAAPAPAEPAAVSNSDASGIAENNDQSVAEQPPAPQPVEVAQNAPPPAAPVQSSSSELPKTASPYPLFGFSGLVMLGLSGFLKMKRSAQQ